MATKKHEHDHDHCEHAHVKFCQRCNRPHCLDCGEEWNRERIEVRYHYWPYYNSIQYTPAIYQSGTIRDNPTITWTAGQNMMQNLQQVVNPNVQECASNVVITTTADCTHSN